MSDPIIEENLKKLVESFAGNFHFLPFSAIQKMSSEHLKQFFISDGHVEFETNFDARDMAWNHMDFTHRPWIHKHYTDGLRTVLGKDISLGFTPWAGTPFLIPTFDVRVSEHEFLHGYNLAGLFYVFVKISIINRPLKNENIWSLNWFILSNKYLRFVHGFLHRSMKKMNKKLFEEDLPVKNFRKNLRERGYRFINDEPDFYTSTILFPNNVKKPAAPSIRVELTSIPIGERFVVKSAEREFLIMRRDENEMIVWDNICSHQGAELKNGEICEGFVTCNWHGLKFAGAHLNSQNSVREFPAFRAVLEKNALHIFPKAST